MVTGENTVRCRMAAIPTLSTVSAHTFKWRPEMWMLSIVLCHDVLCPLIGLLSAWRLSLSSLNALACSLYLAWSRALVGGEQVESSGATYYTGRVGVSRLRDRFRLGASKTDHFHHAVFVISTCYALAIGQQVTIRYFRPTNKLTQQDRNGTHRPAAHRELYNAWTLCCRSLNRCNDTRSTSFSGFLKM